MAMELDLVVHPTFAEEQSVAEATPVARVVRALPVELEEHARVQVRSAQVTWADVGPSDDNLTPLTGLRLLAVFIEDSDARARHRIANRQRRMAGEYLAIDLDRRRGNRSFSGSIRVPDDRLGEAIQQLRHHPMRERLAAE